MAKEITLDSEKLKDLLQAAHEAYKSDGNAVADSSTDWAEWHVNFVLEKLQAASESAEQADKAAESAESSAALPVTAQLKEDTVEAAKPKSVDTSVTATTSDEPPTPERGETLIQADSADQATEHGVQEPPSKTEPDLGALQVCPTCAHRNRHGVLLCENCGTNLLTGQQSGVGTRDLRSEPEEDESDSGDSAAVSSLDSQAQDAVKTAGANVFSGDMYLRIEIDGGPEPIVIRPKSDDMILGRRDPTTGATPEVDLTAFAGYRMGVSRRHASLALKNNQLTLWDMGSSNGTFINGTRLTPHQPSPVRDGDEVRLGQMVIHLFFQKHA